MRILILFTVFIAMSLNLVAKQIPLDKAEEYAVAAYQLYSKDNRKTNQVSIAAHLVQMSGDQPCYFFFNITGGGFVILSAEDTYYPVLGFSSDEQLDLRNTHRLKYIKGELARHEIQIALSREKNFKSISSASSSWSKIREVATTGKVQKNITFQPSVAPLTTTKWDQAGFYNGSCPADEAGPNGRTYCGCLPIAMAQLLKYYENPAPGNGSLTYEDPIYGTQNVDLCGQQFNYADMPDVLTEPNQNLTDFIYDVGKITQTHYSTFYTGTYVSTLENALVYNYGFDSDIKGYHGTDQAKYSSIIKQELDEDRIVFLSGWSIDAQERPEIGHTWLVDGYGYSDTGVEYMHFNWGWGGNNNGWFLDVPGAWTPHPDNPEQATISYYWYRYTVYNIKASGEACSTPRIDLPSAQPFEQYAYIYFQSPYADEERQYRYREAGASEWITSDPTTLYYQFAGNLKKGTTYEYQVARNCCGGWSPFTATKEFTTEGTAPIDPDEPTDGDCPAESEDGFFVTSVSDNFAYAYSARPYGAVNNQFRYKPVSATEWTESDISTAHYRALSNLIAGTSYEYQVRHECEENSWSGYSNSFQFSTTGTAPDGGDSGEGGDDGNNGGDMNGDGDASCPTIPTDNFAVGYATSSGATAYLLQVSGGEKYRFRIRQSGANNTWEAIAETSSTAQNFSGLLSKTTYDIQVGQNCGNGWSEYSESNMITTL